MRESVQSCTVPLLGQQGSYSDEVSLPVLTKMVWLGNLVRVFYYSIFACDVHQFFAV
jgi:hypothetical protein